MEVTGRASVHSRVLVGVLVGVCVLAFVSCQPTSEEVRNPHTSPADVAAGARFFRARCGLCHGVDGTGGRGPDLTRRVFRHGGSDAALHTTVKDGIPRSGMPPSFFLPEESVWQVVAFIRSINRQAVVEPVPGNAENGEELYRVKGDCVRCHMVNGEGGRFGPDLSDVGGLRSVEFLRRSVVEPNADVDMAYWSVEVVLRDGSILSGLRLNEDSFSIRVIDVTGQLHSLWKEDVQDVKVLRDSAMGAYPEGVFMAAELDDLVAYMASLRKEVEEQ